MLLGTGVVVSVIVMSVAVAIDWEDFTVPHRDESVCDNVIVRVWILVLAVGVAGFTLYELVKIRRLQVCVECVWVMRADGCEGSVFLEV